MEQTDKKTDIHPVHLYFQVNNSWWTGRYKVVSFFLWKFKISITDEPIEVFILWKRYIRPRMV